MKSKSTQKQPESLTTPFGDLGKVALTKGGKDAVWDNSRPGTLDTREFAFLKDRELAWPPVIKSYALEGMEKNGHLRPLSLETPKHIHPSIDGKVMDALLNEGKEVVYFDTEGTVDTLAASTLSLLEKMHQPPVDEHGMMVVPSPGYGYDRFGTLVTRDGSHPPVQTYVCKAGCGELSHLPNGLRTCVYRCREVGRARVRYAASKLDFKVKGDCMDLSALFCAIMDDAENGSPSAPMGIAATFLCKVFSLRECIMTGVPLELVHRRTLEVLWDLLSIPKLSKDIIDTLMSFPPGELQTVLKQAETSASPYPHPNPLLTRKLKDNADLFFVELGRLTVTVWERLYGLTDRAIYKL